MHDSMIIAEVGDIENVNGSRIATPLAPPRPGSTPTITPRMMPTTISTILNGCKTTEKPWSRLPISSNISLSPLTRRPSHGGGPQLRPQKIFERPLRQGHQKPDLEHQKREDRNDHPDRNGHEPVVVAQPLHERNDQQRGRYVDSERRDRRDVDRGRHNHRQDLADLSPLRKEFAVIRAQQDLGEVHRAGDHHRQTDVEREEPGPRTLRAPTDANLDASVDSDQREEAHGNGHANLNTPVGRTRPTGFFYRFVHSCLLSCGWICAADQFVLARKPASFIKPSCNFSAFATHFA